MSLVSAKVDVWSLGAVFSEAVIWAALGWSSLHEYRQNRKIENGTDERFYNSHDILNVVKVWHGCLRARHSELSLPQLTQIVDLVEMHTLVMDPNQPSSSATIYAKLAVLLQQFDIDTTRLKLPANKLFLSGNASKNTDSWGSKYGVYENAGWTLLTLAAANCHTSLVKLLLEHRADLRTNGKDVDCRIGSSMTPLMTAGLHGQSDILQLLLDSPQDPWERDDVDHPIGSCKTHSCA